MDKTIDILIECPACKGTGLYVGIAESDGVAVVCNQCKGKGSYRFHYEYNEFTGRKEMDNILRVYECNPGIGIGVDGDRGIDLTDFGGMSYEDWLKNGVFPAGSEMRRFVCPAWWYQITDYSKKPHWIECGFGRFSNCSYFGKKKECWKRFDEETELS